MTVTPPANRPPETVGALPPLTIGLDDDAAALDVSGAFRDPDGDALTYGATSSAPAVAAVAVSGSTVTVTPVGTGTATVSVTATDQDGSNTAAIQSFAVTVVAPFTDHPLVPGETPVRAIHFSELRSRIDALRTRAGLAAYGWTDPVLTARVTPVRLVHLTELRSALTGAYAATGTAGAVLDRRGAGGGGDADPGCAPDGAARLGSRPGVKDLAGVACSARRSATSTSGAQQAGGPGGRSLIGSGPSSAGTPGASSTRRRGRPFTGRPDWASGSRPRAR